MGRLFFVSDSPKALSELQNVLAPLEVQHHFLVAQTLTEVTKRTSEERPAAVVYSVEWLQGVDVKRVENFRSQNLDVPVIVVARRDSSESIEAIKRIQWVVFVEIPFSVKNLIQIAENLLDQKDIRTAVHRRYPTQTKGWMEYGSRKVPVVLANLSLGGACCSMTSLEPWVPGTPISLRINLNDLGRERTMRAWVVWAKRDDSGQMQMVGLKFKAS
jgi:hypothetical protein